MVNAFAWLDQLMTWLGKWVPRLVLIPPTHRGVLFGPRGGSRETGPGLVLYWPITHNLLQVPITTQSLNLSTQILPFPKQEGKGGLDVPKVLICGAAIQFRVVDAVKATTRVLNLHALVDNRASAAIAKFAPDNAPAEWSKLALESVSGELEAYGVLLERLDPTQQGTGVAIKNLSDWGYNDSTNGTHVLSESK